MWTKPSVEMQRSIRSLVEGDTPISQEWMVRNGEVTDMNAALFDVANSFHGCIAGIHEILRRQGLIAGRWCLDSNEDLSHGQMEELDRVVCAYPHLVDDGFVREHLDEWMS